MATDFHATVKQLLFDALDGNIAGASVFDHVPFEPEGATDDSFPLVVIGDTEASAWDNDSELGMQMDASIHVWSRYLGRTQVNAILDDIYGLLHRAALTATGYVIVDVLFAFSDIFVMDDGKTRHGIARYRVTIQEA